MTTTFIPCNTPRTALVVNFQGFDKKGVCEIETVEEQTALYRVEQVVTEVTVHPMVIGYQHLDSKTAFIACYTDDGRVVCNGREYGGLDAFVTFCKDFFRNEHWARWQKNK